jgi:hypothetical protein
MIYWYFLDKLKFLGIWICPLCYSKCEIKSESPNEYWPELKKLLVIKIPVCPKCGLRWLPYKEEKKIDKALKRSNL